MADYTLSAKITADAKEFSKAFDTAQEKMQGLQTKFSETGDKMKSFGTSMTKRVTAPLVGIGGASIKVGIDFEKAMSGVGAVMGATAEDMATLEAAAREAGATTDKSATDAAKALEYMGLAGWSVQESTSALLPILKLSSAANMDLGRTSDLVTDTMSVLGLTTDDLGGYLDILAQTSRNSNTNVDQLGEAMLSVGGKATALGVGTEDLAVTLGILADNGIKGSEAGTGLNAVITNLTAPTGEAKKALEELGVSAFDAEGNFIGIEGTFQLLKDSMKGMTTEQENMYLSMIGGKAHGDVMAAMLGGLDGGFQDLTGKVNGSTGALDEMYDTATNNTMGAINELKSAAEELGISIFKNLQPHVESFVAWLQKLTDKFNGLSPEQQDMIIKIGLIAAAIGPLLIIFGTFAGSMSKLIGLGSTLVGNWGKIKAFGAILKTGLSSTVGFLFSPAGAILLGIAAVIAIGVLLYKNWDVIKEKASALKANVSAQFKQIGEDIMKPVNAAKEAVGKAIDTIKSFFSGMKLKFPKIEMPKMPKFSLTGKFSLVPPSVPRVGISWNAKGGIFTKPTLLGGNQGVGEAGAEAVLPIAKLGTMLGDTMKRMGYENDIRRTTTGNNINNNEITFNLNGAIINDPRDIREISKELAKEFKREVNYA